MLLCPQGARVADAVLSFVTRENKSRTVAPKYDNIGSSLATSITWAIQRFLRLDGRI